LKATTWLPAGFQKDATGTAGPMQSICMRPGNTIQVERAGPAAPPSLRNEGLAMYAVIRTGGKQYLVSPGERLKIERTGTSEGAIEFSDVIAVSPEEGKFASDLAGAKVTGTVLGEGRGDKILVFKLKRKKQYKKMQGHRQNFVEVRINEITVNGQSYKAEGAEAVAPKAEKKPAAKKAAKKTEAAAE
jgi:large subunit ribosomal protein L21